MLVTTSHHFFENESIRTIQNVIEEKELKYYINDLSKYFQFKHPSELEDAIDRSIEICKTAELNLREHFKLVFRDIDGVLVTDWKISLTAYRLIVINGNPANNLVAQAQLKLLERVTDGGIV